MLSPTAQLGHSLTEYNPPLRTPETPLVPVFQRGLKSTTRAKKTVFGAVIRRRRPTWSLFSKRSTWPQFAKIVTPEGFKLLQIWSATARKVLKIARL
jgi:hypothetical protein